MHATPRRLGRLALALALLCGLAGCGVLAEADAGDVTADFLDALAAGDTARAAGLTDAPDSARVVLDQARAALRPRSLRAQVRRVHDADGSSAAEADFGLTWQLDGDRTWAYEGHARLNSAGESWKLHWEPAVLHPELAARQGLAIREDVPGIAPVLDRDGTALLEPQQVTTVSLDPARAGDLDGVAARLAAALHPVEPSITQKSIVDGARTVAPGAAYPVASLRPADYQRVRAGVRDLPGLRFPRQVRLLPADRELGRQLMPALRAMAEPRMRGQVGWRIVTVNQGGAEVDELHAVPARPADAAVSTISAHAQSAAQAALAGAGVPGVIVALRPSTGELLAVAQNAEADRQGQLGLTGRYPPGSTFKIVTAAAGLTANRVTAHTSVDCPGTTTVDGRVIPNNNRFSLGIVPLTEAFAQSCNTTFAALATGLPATALTDSARDLGIGADFDIPGLTTITGSVPPATSVVGQAENGFGQGTDLVSPLGMALAAGTVAAGRTPVPTLLRGVPTDARGLGRPLRPDVLAALREMMRDVITGGTAAALGDLPGVHGKTGTAQYGDGKHAHGWFAGYAGDLAFSVLLVGRDGSTPAVRAASAFLKAAR